MGDGTTYCGVISVVGDMISGVNAVYEGPWLTRASIDFGPAVV